MIKLHCFEQDKLKVKVSLSICHCNLNIAKYLLLFIFMNFIVPLSYSRCPILKIFVLSVKTQNLAQLKRQL